MQARLEHHCPRCQIPLASLDHQGTRPSVCGRCRGLFVRGEDLRAQLGDSAEMIESADRAHTASGAHIECPKGCALMEPRVVVQGTKSVVIDRCPSCQGLWLDGGEVRVLLALGRERRAQTAGHRAARTEAEAIESAKRRLADDLAFLRNADDQQVTKSSTGWWLVSFLTKLPLEGFNPVYRFPYMTWTILIVTAAVFGWELVSVEMMSTETIVRSLAVIENVVAGAPREAYRLVTYLFIHGSWLHFLGNAYFLKIFGDNVEDRLGSGWFLFFYLACGAIAAGAHMAAPTDPDTPLLGASGAIGGLLGAYLVFFSDARVSIAPQLLTLFRQVHLPAFFFLAGWLAIQILAAMIGGDQIAWWAHVGGFIAGVALALIARRLIPDARIAYLARRARSVPARPAQP